MNSMRPLFDELEYVAMLAQGSPTDGALAVRQREPGLLRDL